MADVRLTATNPEDSSVVPVACNEKGELKLEEPLVVEGPPGEKGDKGDKGDPGDKGDKGEKGDPGDSFSGDFDGDVTFNGKVNVPTGGSWYPYAPIKDEIQHFSSWLNVGVLRLNVPESYEDSVGWGSFAIRDSEGKDALYARGDGSVNFAYNKAGITSEGYFYCTTRRGDRVILDFTSNGTGVWVPYTRLMENDLFDEWSEKNGIRPMPEDLSQDEPENTQ